MLDDFQEALYEDRAYLYRRDPKHRNVNGDITGIVRIEVGPGINTRQQLVGKMHTTPNFDNPISGGALGQHKEQNIFTSDVWCADPDTDIRPGDYLYLLTQMPGQWRRVGGIANVRRSLANYTEAYLSLCDAPIGVILEA